MKQTANKMCLYKITSSLDMKYPCTILSVSTSMGIPKDPKFWLLNKENEILEKHNNENRDSMADIEFKWGGSRLLLLQQTY